MEYEIAINCTICFISVVISVINFNVWQERDKMSNLFVSMLGLLVIMSTTFNTGSLFGVNNVMTKRAQGELTHLRKMSYQNQGNQKDYIEGLARFRLELEVSGSKLEKLGTTEPELESFERKAKGK